MTARGVVVGLSLVLAASSAGAGGVERWEVNGTALGEGEADGVMVTPRDGARPAPPGRRVLAPDESTVWSVAVDAGGRIVAGGGEAGRVYLVSPDGASAVLHAFGDGEVFAVAFDEAGGVLAAHSPQGVVARVPVSGGEAEVVFDPGEEYVWDLLAGPGGDLLVATGGPGRVYRVSPGRPPEIVVDPEREHVRCLARDREGRLLMGTSGRATVARLDGGRAFVLHDAGDGEITDIAVDPADGGIWVAVARGGSDAAKPASGSKDDADGGKAPESPRKPGGSGASRGTVLRIEPDGLVLTVAELGDESPLSLASAGPGLVLVGTGDAGRVLMVDRDGRVGVRLDTTSRQVHALAVDGELLAAGVSNVAGLLVSSGPGSGDGTLVSPVRDAGRAARWGRIRVTGERPRGARLDVALRGGNTAEPDAGWSDWTAVDGDPLAPDGASVRLAPSRFVQFRLTLGPGRDTGPVARGVTLRYRPANRPPKIKSLELEPAGLAYRALPPSRVASGEQSVLVDPVPPAVEEKLSGNNRGSGRSKKAFEPGVRTAVWDASDDDGDRLLFEVDVAPASGGAWLPLARELDGSFHAFDTRALPDGRYRLRLKAHDRRDNDPGSARSVETISEPFLVDNRAPEIRQGRVSRQEDGSLQVTFVGRDDTGPVVRGEVSVAGGPWRSVMPDDAIGDAREERFTAELPAPADERAPVRVRVMDEAGNIAAAEITAAGE